MKVKKNANAKINIGLEVLNKRGDNFHNINTIFYTLNGLYDELIFETPKANAKEILNIMKDMMEKAVKLDIPLIADAAIGKNWNEAH